MSKNKKARPDAWTFGQAQNGAFCENYTLRGGSSQFEIAELLGHGPENGLHLSDLVRLTGWTEREVRRIIQAERLRGVPILSNCKDGYFLPETESDRAACVRSLRGRAQEILSVADSIDAAGVGPIE